MNKITMKNIALNALFLLSISVVSLYLMRTNENAHAKTDTKTKLQNDAADLKKETKSNVRKMKRKVRDATGHGSVKKDVQDTVDEMSDDVTTESEKMKRNLNNK